MSETMPSATAQAMMSETVISALWNESLLDADRKMKNHGIRHLPVVTDGGRLIGILSDRDVLRSEIVLEELRDRQSTGAIVSDELASHLLVINWMTSPVQTVSARASVREIAEKMIRERISAVVVTNDAGQVDGIVTTVDFLKLFLNDDDDASAKTLRLLTSVGSVANFLSQSGI
jgi:CBS domain-containing protein